MTAKAVSKNTGTAPVWLFTGPENGEKNAEIEKIKLQAEKQHGNLENYKYYAQDIKTGDLVSLLQNGSLFSAGKFVVLGNAELIKLKDEITTLTDWIHSVTSVRENPENNSFLILLSDEISIDKKIETAVPDGHKKIFWELFEDRKEQWIVSFFKKEGLSIDEKAVRLILEMVENNTEALRAACSPFPLFYGKGTMITENEVEYIISHNKEENAFTLFDALSKHDFENAAAVFRKISLSKDSSPPQVIAGLSYCFRRLQDWHSLEEQAGGSGRNIPADMLRKGGFSGIKIQNQYRSAARVWNKPAVEGILAMLTDADGELRSSGGQIQNMIFEYLLYRISKAGRINNARVSRF